MGTQPLTAGSNLSAAKLALLERARRATALARVEPASILPREAGKPAPLSTGQEQMWFFSRLSPDLDVYNDGATIRKRGTLDLDALRSAFNEVVRRHEVWRTNFPVVDGVPVQQVQPPPTYELPLTDLSHLPVHEREMEAIRLATEEARLPYDLARDRLVRPRLVRLAEDDHRLYLALHHIIFDGVSLHRVLMPELVALYDAYLDGRPSPLAEPALQYGDFAAWEREHVDDGQLSRRLTHWRRQLGSELSSADLPFDHERPPIQRFRGAIAHVDVEPGVVKALKDLAQREGASFFMIMAAAFCVLLRRYSTQDDVIFGSPLDTRSRPELQSMMGVFLNAVVLRVDAAGDPSFTELLQRVRDVALTALANEVPFDRLVRELQKDRDLSHQPIFQVMFVVEPPPPRLDPAWSIHQMDTGPGTAQYDLNFELDERPEGHVSCRMIYSTDLFDAETIGRMGGHWLQLLHGIVADPDRRISELPLLCEAERRQLLVEWNATEAEIPEACVHELFEGQAERTPEATALVFEDQQLSYAELNARANQLAHHLTRLGVGPDVTVGLCVERSVEMLVGMLGILKAGGAYVPLDPRYPADRLVYMLEDSGTRLLVTQARLGDALRSSKAEVVCLDRDARSWAGEPEAAPGNEVRPGNLAYVIYTSGSTGKPKGVEVEHRSLVNLLCSMVREPGLGPGSALLAITTLSFDIAGVELYLPLISGGKVVIAGAKVSSDGSRLARLLADQNITFLQATPATWRIMVESGWRGAPDLTALSGGEALTSDLAQKVLERCRRLYNGYGPTETTIYSAFDEIRPGSPITIGRPPANTRLYVLDRYQQPVPVGVPGELYIGGAGLARGYRNRPELTAERFVASTFIAGERLYRTGDLVRYHVDGKVEYLGRLDTQIKLRGYRIEPGEIEVALLAHPAVRQAVVLAREDRPGDRRLVAYLVAACQPPELGELREHLRRSLPDYMVPSVFVWLEEFPLSPNGKLDRKALRAPDGDGSVAEVDHVPARTPVEAALVEIWAEVLGVERLGIRDNFFMLGGHSLLAAQLVARIRVRFGVEIALISLFAAGTVADLADEVQRSLEGRGLPTPTSASLSVVAQASGGRPALFFLVSDESGLTALHHFIRALGTDQPVVGLVPPRQNRRFQRGKGIVQLGEALVAEIRARQPHGPYALCGHSLGGLLAYEVAGQLRSIGEEVAWLGLLDTATPAASVLTLMRSRRLVSRLRRYWARTRQVGLPAMLGAMAARQLRLLRASLGLPLPPDQFDHQGVEMLMKTYRVVAHAGPLDVFVTGTTSKEVPSAGLGWKDLHRGQIRCHPVVGDHNSVLHRPDVTMLEVFARRLREAQETCLRGLVAARTQIEPNATSCRPDDFSRHR